MICSLVMSAFVCYVGSNPGSSENQALKVLSVDAANGAIKELQMVNGPVGTTYFQLDSKGEYLYSAISEKTNKGQRGVAVRFPVLGDGTLGVMERLAELPCEAPCHIMLSADSRRYFAAAYLSGTVVSMAIDGSDLRTYKFPADAMGPNAARQASAYAHFVFTTIDGKALGAIDLGCDRIRFFDPITLEVKPSLEIKADPGDGPRHAVWSKDGRFLFVLNELSSSIAGFAFNGESFAKIGKWSMLPDNFNRWGKDGKTLSTKAAAIKLTNDGKLLIASNRGYDSLTFFAVDLESGQLERKNIALLRGRFPRDFELVPGERFIMVGHKLSDEVQVYAFNRTNCALTPVGEALACYHPLCFKFKNRNCR